MSQVTLEDLSFGSRFVDELPADPDTRNMPRQVQGACWSFAAPTPVPAPRLLAHSAEVAADLGLGPDAHADPGFADILSGNRQVAGMTPHATCYGGHQFGQWAGQLGDGRAINLGEVRCPDGVYRILQLKGAGPTPYSRTADGLAVLRSSIREFLCSEAMHHLGIPTTRALSLVATGRDVLRDMLYDGHPRLEPGAVVCRVAPSFTRFGHFEIFAARGEHELLQQLADFTIRADFPHLSLPPGAGGYAAWFEDICLRTADLIVEWQRVGFVHGVMNTDNMSILGLTIDYGPYGWIDDYDPDWTPNTTDAGGRRYRFGHQSLIAYWNLVQLANALHPLIGAIEPLQAALDGYVARYEAGWRDMMTRKLGLQRHDPALDGELISELLTLLPLAETDMTIFFRELSGIGPTQAEGTNAECLFPLEAAWYRPETIPAELRQRWLNWMRRYAGRLRLDGEADATRVARMHAANPRYVLRNYLAQQAIDLAEQGDASRISELLDLLRRPYTDQPGREAFAEKRPDWARHKPGCSMLSCSS